MTNPRRKNPRAEYRQQQIERANASVSLAEKFPGLSSLKVDLAYLDAETLTGNSQMKYSVNVSHAKSVFCFMCPSAECVGGDFDLSGELEKAIAKRKKVVVGEMRCLGWQTRAKVERAPCRTLLRYTLKLLYD